MPEHRHRATHIAKLEKLLDVAGTTTPWETIAQALKRCPVEVLVALTYRVERAMAEERVVREHTERTGYYDDL